MDYSLVSLSSRCNVLSRSLTRSELEQNSSTGSCGGANLQVFSQHRAKQTGNRLSRPIDRRRNLIGIGAFDGSIGWKGWVMDNSIISNPSSVKSSYVRVHFFSEEDYSNTEQSNQVHSKPFATKRNLIKLLVEIGQ